MPSNASNNLNPTDPSIEISAITPSDSTDLVQKPRALYVGVGGDVVVIAANDTASVTLVGVSGGTVLPIRIRRVLATGTTATSLVALY